jgi:tripartite-type tricarboxylate transporter receptor subunit TctC
MNYRYSSLFAALGIGLAAVFHCATSSAQSFPEGRITMVVGFGAGGMTDVTSRILASKLEKLLGTTVIVENRTGAGGTVAIKSVGQMPADGHTLVSFLTDGPFTAAYQDRPIDLADWAIIGGYMPQERVLFAAKTAPFNTAREMMEYAKKTPITMTDGGSFWSGRVMEAFAKKHGLQIAVVAQRSGQAGSNEVMGGHVTMAETGTGTPAWSAAKNGELKILATLTPGGLAGFGMPDIPTFEKLGADFVARMFYGYAVRAATPADRVEKLRAAFKQAVDDPEVHAQIARIDLTPTWIDPKTYEATLRKVAEDGVKLREYLKKK